ncbi:ferrous iron transporter B [Magnetospirillum moscoviense]|uniref:Fe(2+) transporter FeoB n=1 Tax=Magnetospirillum moscoviense TaxID=1437059 RepID=A0A178MN41_9PROT|nr:ferrous iron transporter B [Magnetospirillum moscoviense]OAN49963.1 ferrous iron transporter B [Magnetospirillum moscoviense]
MSRRRAEPRLALVGNPNCGKTALFNALTGSRQKVANYAGVTVERKEGLFVSPAGTRVKVIDLPGTYSLRARSPDEEVTRDVVLGRFEGEDLPDAIVFVADATNLRQNLRLVLELKRLGHPLILALNMMDEAEKMGLGVDSARLSAELGVPVVPTIAVQAGGVQALLDQIDRDILVANAEGMAPSGAVCHWHEPSSHDLRDYHREVLRILSLCILTPGRGHSRTRTIDRVLLHPLTGLLILLTVLFLMFQAVFAWAAAPMEAIDLALGALTGWLDQALPDGLAKSLVNDGIIAGVGSVVIFLPQILVLFLFIQVLEDSGYMARAAFLLDRLMGGVGLHGRAFIPLLSSFACAVPGIMAARTIENRADRIATIMIAPLMTCSARLPVYTLIIAAFVPDRTLVGGWIGLPGLVMFALYASGILSGLLVALVMKSFWLKGAREPLLMELPAYRLPRVRNVALGLFDRAKAFLTRAGTTIFALMVVVWFLGNFPAPPDGATEPAIRYSIAGALGYALEPLVAPIGFNWQIALALVPGMAAREVAVGVLGTIYALSESGDALQSSLAGVLGQSWGLPTALSLLAWYVFAPQCLSTLSVVRRELNSRAWPALMFVLLTALAYGAAFVTYRLAQTLL